MTKPFRYLRSRSGGCWSRNNRGMTYPIFTKTPPPRSSWGPPPSRSRLQAIEVVKPRRYSGGWLNKVPYTSTAGGAWCPDRTAIATSRRYPIAWRGRRHVESVGELGCVQWSRKVDGGRRSDLGVSLAHSRPRAEQSPADSACRGLLSRSRRAARGGCEDR